METDGSGAWPVTDFHKHTAAGPYSYSMKNMFALPLNRRSLLSTASALALWGTVRPTWAADESPEGFIKRITNETLDTIKADKSLRNGDVSKIIQLVDAKLMPHVNFRRMTALATGPAWRKATPEQQKRLQEEFKILLVRTYSGALSQVSDQVVVVKPLRAGQEDKNLVVNTEVRGKGDPIQLDYRLEKTPGEGAGWMIFDLNVLGVWLIENYRTQFTKEINAGGLDALIASLVARNKSNAKPA
jgi:phospholipid transport system substrate-binding protein